tara:strand:+ start:232 stop:1254 length:1023 start_codon:yes stop_codon:yes gene_type:complete
MDKELGSVYVCPYTRAQLELQAERTEGSDVVTGRLTAPDGKTYPITDGIPCLIDSAKMAGSADEEREMAFYQEFYREYDGHMEWLFRSFFLDEFEVRSRVVDMLRIKPNDRVLEVGCGTCRDSELIAERLSSDGVLFLQDLSENMLKLGRERLRELLADKTAPRIEYSLGSALHLALPNDCVDAAFHFGGLNLFAEVPAALAEMARVVKPGGRVVVGDESVAPWLRGHDFGKILMNSHHLYRFEAPIADLPACADEVSLHWIVANAFYVIEFTVAEGPPAVDLDLTIPGPRGGTHRTRYFGATPGVSPNLRDKALAAAAEEGQNLHQWLEQAMRDKLGDS